MFEQIIEEDDDCKVVQVIRERNLLQKDVKIIESDADDDDIQLIKVERITKPFEDLKKKALQSIINRLKQDNNASEETAGSDPLTIQKYFPCSECKRIFATAIDLIQHSSKVHEKRVSRHKKKLGRRPSKKFQCKICALEFSKQVSLAAHMNLHRSTQESVEFTFKCKDCDEMFRSNGSLWNHRKLRHMSMIYKCNICCKTFATESAYNEHIQKHEAEGPNICDICHKNFTLHASLVIHKRLHTGQLPYLCAQCGKSFNTNNRLQEHLRRHEGDRRYECNVCSKRFYEKSDLKKHEYTHNGSEKPHTCYYCGKGFIMAGSLQIHIRTHTGERPYECEYKDICQKRFVTKSQMKRHLRVHTGNVPNFGERRS